VVSVVFHHPNWREVGALIPLESPPLAYAFSRLIRTNPVRRRAALALVRVPGALAATRTLLPYVGLVAQRRGAQRPYSWFTRLIASEDQLSGVVLNTSWRGRGGAVLLHAIDNQHGEAAAIAKTWLSADGDSAVSREAAGLEKVARRAGDFGVRVPRLLKRGALGEKPYLVETALTGEKAAVLLHGQPQLLEGLLARLADWLVAWNSATAQPRVLTHELLDRLLLRPAAELEPALRAGAVYQYGLRALAGRLLGQTMPFVAAHGDLTMVNVLMDEKKPLGVIDWETASESGLPLTDFYYAAVDAAAAVYDYRDRPAAYAACFAAGGRYRDLVARLEARIVEALALTADQVDLSFQASWLVFALAERRETAKSAPDEFLEIARRAATEGYRQQSGQLGPG
jgi:Ser/Thr protein kinase RdoA (MazF antagonist)